MMRLNQLLPSSFDIAMFIAWSYNCSSFCSLRCLAPWPQPGSSLRTWIRRKPRASWRISTPSWRRRRLGLSSGSEPVRPSSTIPTSRPRALKTVLALSALPLGASVKSQQKKSRRSPINRRNPKTTHGAVFLSVRTTLNPSLKYSDWRIFLLEDFFHDAS